MTYTKVDYRDVEPVGGALHVLRESLDCSRMGFSVIECPPGWTGSEHRHRDTDPGDVYAEDHEEVYFLVSGAATVVVDGDEVELGPGDALRVAPEATRQVRNGDEESLIVVAGAP